MSERNEIDIDAMDDEDEALAMDLDDVIGSMDDEDDLDAMGDDDDLDAMDGADDEPEAAGKNQSGSKNRSSKWKTYENEYAPPDFFEGRPYNWKPGHMPFITREYYESPLVSPGRKHGGDDSPRNSKSLGAGPATPSRNPNRKTTNQLKKGFQQFRNNWRHMKSWPRHDDFRHNPHFKGSNPPEEWIESDWRVANHPNDGNLEKARRRKQQQWENDFRRERQGTLKKHRQGKSADLQKFRIAAILMHPAARGRKALAEHLAYNTALLPSAAINALRALPRNGQPRSAAHTDKINARERGRAIGAAYRAKVLGEKPKG